MKVDRDGSVNPMDKADVKVEVKAELKVRDRVLAKWGGKDYPGVVDSLPAEGEENAGKVMVKVDKDGSVNPMEKADVELELSGAKLDR